MASPFPGMDPYLENPEIFPDFHDSVITYLREALQASLPAPYFAVLGRRVWIEVSRRSIGPDLEMRREGKGPTSLRAEPAGGLALANPPLARPVVVKVAHDEFREPFVEIYARNEVAHDEFREPFVEIYARNDEGKRLVSSIEVLSLSNKTEGEHGRDLYVRKQKELLASKVHLVEIDLLRGGEHVTAVPLDLARDACGAFDYYVSVHDFADLETFYVYPIRLEERLPPVAIPLLPGDPAVTLDLQAVFDRCFNAGPYLREIRYGEDTIVLSLDPVKAAWAAKIVRIAPA
jgi:hypothetical protein